jgi:hypothetical protein
MNSKAFLIRHFLIPLLYTNKTHLQTCEAYGTR